MRGIRRIVLAGLLTAGVAALGLAVGGCAAMATRPPGVSLANVSIEEFGLLEQRLGLTLRVMNPNDADLPIDGVSFDVDVNGQHFAKGVSSKAVTIPRLGEALVDVSAVTTLGDLLRQLGQLAKGGRRTVEYRVHGRLYGVGLNGVPFDTTRELKLPALPLFPAPEPQPRAGSVQPGAVE